MLAGNASIWPLWRRDRCLGGEAYDEYCPPTRAAPGHESSGEEFSGLSEPVRKGTGNCKEVARGLEDEQEFPRISSVNSMVIHLQNIYKARFFL